MTGPHIGLQPHHGVGELISLSGASLSRQLVCRPPRLAGFCHHTHRNCASPVPQSRQFVGVERSGARSTSRKVLGGTPLIACRLVAARARAGVVAISRRAIYISEGQNNKQTSMLEFTHKTAPAPRPRRTPSPAVTDSRSIPWCCRYAGRCRATGRCSRCTGAGGGPGTVRAPCTQQLLQKSATVTPSTPVGRHGASGGSWQSIRR